MGNVKVTFTLDSETVNRLDKAAERLSYPKSRVIREAVADYYERIGRLSERERAEMLRAFDELLPRIPRRPRRDAERELRSIRQARRSGGRKTPV
jgi:predicted transcriptional regulator